MKKSIFAKLLACVLSMIMVITALPIVSFANETTWRSVASTNFARSTWSAGSSDSLGNSLSGNTTVTAGDGGASMSWNAYEWNNSYINVDANGANIANGFIYLSGYGDNSKTPITGSEAFKIDVEFMFTGDFSISAKDTSTFMKISTNTSSNLSFVSENAWSNCFFAQDGYGRTHVSTASPATTNEGSGYRISTDDLSKNTEYHYIVTYSSNHIRSYVADANGNIVIDYGAYRAALDTNAITGIYLGSCKSYYYNNVAYKTVTMYNGTTETGEKPVVAADKDKYLFTYFTGNDEAGETLHMAVSDDGYNWEALNGNQPIWDSSKLTGSEVSYPDNSGTAASGHVRDPYAFQAEDGSYYVLATDLNTENGSNWGNNSKMMVWHLDSMADLGNTNPWYIDTSSIMINAGITDSVSRAWAPEAIYDPEAGHYMLFWACGYINGATYMYYAYTDDFKTLLTEPKQLIKTSGDNIDGNITYDGSLYYLWFKDESNSKIGYATSEHASGPYSQYTAFTDTDYESHFEGPEVYQLYGTGSYVLMADHYSTFSFFATYASQTLNGFENNQIKTTNINQLSPRHGSVINITTAEYNELVAAYGKATYDATGVDEGKNVNDYLIARYFTNDDATYDATGHGNTLTNNGVTMTSNFEGKVAAQFTGTATDSTSAASGSTQGDSYNKNGTYMTRSTSDMFADLNAKDGVTFSWYGYASNANSGRWFDWSTAEAGNVSWNAELSGTLSQTATQYVYSASNMEFGANNYGATAIATGYKGTSYKGAWHLYTMSVVNGYISYFVDGVLLRTDYATNGESVSKQGAPIALSSMTDDFFNNIKNGNLYLGISSYAADEMLNGYISDFRIYSKALSASDIQDSLEGLAAYIPSKDVDETHRVYYDSMDDYSASISDDVHGTVLNLTGTDVKANSNYSISSKTCDSEAPSATGYTLSMWYNPGEELSGCFFNLGTTSTSDTGKRDYLVLNEDGRIWYCYSTSSVDAYAYVNVPADVFSGKLKTNEWNHITLQVEPNGSYEYIYVYVNGSLTSTINTYLYSTISQNGTDGTVYNYFNQDNTVYYGADYGSKWGKATGMIDEVSIYDELYSAESVYKNDCNAIADSLLNICISDYKEYMSILDSTENDGFVYNNMQAAYEAYDAVMRYIDSYTYGTTVPDSGEIVELYNALENAIANMTKYYKPTGIEGIPTQQYNYTSAIDAAYTNNLLSYPALGTVYEGYKSGTSGDKGTNGDFLNFRVSDQNFVWLYTGEGDYPTAPIRLGTYTTKTSTTIYGNYLFVDNSNADSKSTLVIGTENDANSYHVNTSGANAAVDWYVGNSAASKISSDQVYSSAKTGGSTNNFKITNYTGNIISYNYYWNEGSGVLRYTGTLTEEDGFIYNISPMYYNNIYWRTTSVSNGYSEQYNGDVGTIKIINFLPVKSAMLQSEYLQALSSITGYSPASAQELLSAYDNLTGLSYITTYDQTTALTESMQKVIDDLNAVDLTKLAKKASYTDAITTVESYTQFYEASDGNEVIKNGSEYESTGEVYTTSSWDAFEHAYNSIEEHFTSLNPFTEDQPYATNQDVVDALQSYIDKSFDNLVVVADYSDVDTACTNDAVVANEESDNYNADGQIYTYDSYIAFDDAYNAADTWHSKDAAYRADTEKYAVEYSCMNDTGVTGPYIAYDSDGNIVTSASQEPYYYKFIGEFYENAGDSSPTQFQSGDYVLIDGQYIKLNGYRYSVDSVAKPAASSDAYTYSLRQQSIIDTAADLLTKNDALVTVDAPDAYTSFDSVRAVVNSIDRNKYTDEALAALDEAVAAAQNSVYVTLTGDTLAKYNAATDSSFAEGTEIKNTALYATDPVSAALLSFIETDLNAEANKDKYVKKFRAVFTLQDPNADDSAAPLFEQTAIAYYGETFDFTATGYEDCGIQYSVTTYSGTASDADDETYFTDDNVLGSTKFGYGANVSRIADANVKICGNVTGNDANSSTYRVEIYNIYNRLVQVLYTAEMPTADTLPAADPVPFYTFSSYSISDADSDNVVKVRAVYTPNPSYKITVEDGASISGKVLSSDSGTSCTVNYDTLLTITNDSIENFYAWAVDNGDGTYQVASYNSEYSFYSCANENYVAITQVDGKYYIGDNLITASMLDSVTTFNIGSVADLTADDYVQAKLAAKAPFISIENVVRSDSKARAYSRITEGAEFNSCSVTMYKGDAERTYAVNNILSTGQFIVTLTTTDSVSFKTAVSYDFTYSFTGSNTEQNASADINALDYSVQTQAV